MYLSLRGIARMYYGTIGDFSVIDTIFPGEPIFGVVRLRERLENAARREHEFDFSECIYGATAAFEQTWTHIRVRIELDRDLVVPAATMNTLRTTWRNAIVNTWSNRWGCGRAREATCPLVFEVQWVSRTEHHTVRVRLGPA